MKNTFNVASCVDRLPWQDYMDDCGFIIDWGWNNAVSVEECPPIVYHHKCDGKLVDVVTGWMKGSKTEQVKKCKNSMGNRINLPSFCSNRCNCFTPVCSTNRYTITRAERILVTKIQTITITMICSLFFFFRLITAGTNANTISYNINIFVPTE